MGTWREICTEQNLSYILLLIITIITMASLGRVYSSQVVFNRMALLIDSMIELVLGLVWTNVKPYITHLECLAGLYDYSHISDARQSHSNITQV